MRLLDPSAYVDIRPAPNGMPSMVRFGVASQSRKSHGP